MNLRFFAWSARFLFLLTISVPAAAQTAADPELVAEIAKIKAIDNHSHMLPADTSLKIVGQVGDSLDHLDSTDPVLLRVGPQHHDYIQAWRAMYGYAHADMNAEHAREAYSRKRKIIEEKGDAYPAWALDQAGIETSLVNSDLPLGPGLTAPRFLWVPQAAGLVMPFAQWDDFSKRFLSPVNLSALPTGWTEFKTRFVTANLEGWKRSGAVAIKFPIAYYRPLDFADAQETDARRIYEKYVQKGKPTGAESKILTDFLFRFVAREAGRLGLSVHIHTGVGDNPYFNVSGSNPALLEPSLNDPSLRNTKFVLIHGGWPFDKQAGVMLMKANLYADFSAQLFLRSTRAISQTLRDWLEWAPEKILFGTDAYSEAGAPLATWEEKAWITTRVAREALAIALTGMMQDGELTREQAVQLARMALRDNAIKLYGLKTQ